MNQLTVFQSIKISTIESFSNRMLSELLEKGPILSLQVLVLKTQILMAWVRVSQCFDQSEAACSLQVSLSFQLCLPASMPGYKTFPINTKEDQSFTEAPYDASLY